MASRKKQRAFWYRNLVRKWQHPWLLDEQFPDVDTEAFLTRLMSGDDYDIEQGSNPRSFVSLDPDVPFRDHPSLKVIMNPGSLDLYRAVPDLSRYWLGYAVRFPSTFMSGRLDSPNIIQSDPSTNPDQPLEFNVWDNGGQFAQFVQPSGINIHGTAPNLFSSFEAAGDNYDEWVFDDEQDNSSNRLPITYVPLGNWLSDHWLQFASLVEQTGSSLRCRTWYSMNQGGFWMALMDQSLTVDDLGNDSLRPAGWVELYAKTIPGMNSGEYFHLGMWQIADANEVGGADPYRVF